MVYGGGNRWFHLERPVPVKCTAHCRGTPVLTGAHTQQAVPWSDSTTAGTPIRPQPNRPERPEGSPSSIAGLFVPFVVKGTEANEENEEPSRRK